MSSNTNIGNTPVNQGYVQLIHTGETGGIDGTLRTLYDGDGTASDLQIASNKVKISTQLYIGSDTLQEYIQDTVGAMLVTNASHTNLSAAYDDAGDGAIDLTASGDVTLSNSVTLSNKTLAAPTLTGTTQGASITLSGDLTVNGTTTTVNQTNLDVSDNIIGLNRGASSNANDSGLIIERGSTGDNAAIIWDESADKFTLGTTTSTPSATGDLTISTGTLVANVEGNISGNLTTDSVTISTIQTGSESFADNDTSLMTSAAIQDKILSYGYSSGAVSAVANGADNRIATFSSSTALNGEANLTFDSSNVLTATDGSESMAYTPSNNYLTIHETGATKGSHLRLATDNSDFILTAGGGTNQLSLYDVNGTANRLVVNSSGTFHFQHHVTLQPTKKLFLDGGTHTYITEEGADNIAIYAGGTRLLQLVEGGTNYVAVGDGTYLGAGNDLDFYMTHNGTDTTIGNSVGDLYIQNNTDDKDVILRCDDGSGGVTPYLTLDGSATTVNVAKNMLFPDSVEIKMGNGPDFDMSHNGSNSYIRNWTGDLYINNNTTDGDVHFLVDDGGGNDITALKIDASETGRVLLPNDNQLLSIGAGQDLYMFHDGTDSHIRTQTGDLYLTNVTSNEDIILRVNDGGSTINAIYIDASDAGTAIFNHDVRVQDNGKLQAGTAGDLQIFHDGTDNYIKSVTSNQDFIIQVNDGGSYMNAIKVDSSEVGKVLLPNDGQILSLGASADLKIQHDGTNSWIYNTTSGHLYIENRVDDKDLIFRGDDGSGGLTAYLTLDGSATQISIAKNMKFGDGVKTLFGAGEDVQLFHDSTYGGFLFNQTNDFYFDQVAADKDWIFRVDDSDGGGDYQEVMRIQGSTQRVGIGTASPGAKLHVAEGFAYIYQTDGVGKLELRDSRASYDAEISQRSDGRISLATRAGTYGSNGSIEILDSGNVGIGTTSPSVELHVKDASSHAQLRIETDSASHGAYLELEGSANKYQIYNVGGDLGIDESGVATRLTIKDSTGNVGIGTSSPAGKLHIQESGTGAGSGGVISETATHNGNSGYRWRTNGTDRWAVTTIGTNGADLRFRDEDAGAERMRINSSGNVGIGTASPEGKVHIYNGDASVAPDSDGDELVVENSGDSGISILSGESNGNTGSLIFGSQNDGNGAGVVWDYYNKILNVKTQNSSGILRFASANNSEAMRILANANVGIGTSSPAYKLDVAGQGKVTNGWLVDNGTTAGFFTTDSDNVNFGASTSGKGLKLFSANAEAMRIDTSGRVLIGDTSVHYTGVDLQVGSTSDGQNGIQIQTSTTGYGYVLFGDGTGADAYRGQISYKQGDDFLNFITAGAEAVRIDSSQDAHFDQDVIAFSTTPSDIRLKENFEKIENGLDVVSKLEGHTFNWKKGGERLSAGFKAQEVEKILPHLVDEKKLPLRANDDKEYKILRYEEMIPYLVEAIKEQQEEIECLKANYDQLKYNRR